MRNLAVIFVALLGAYRARADEVAELFGDVARRFQVLAGQHDDELLAAIARREPKPVKEMLHALRDQPQHFVAQRMSPAVVEVLEMIDVEEAQGQRLSVRQRAGGLRSRIGFEGLEIGSASGRERVSM